MRLSLRWAERSRVAFGNQPGRALFGIVQGGVEEVLRRESAQTLAAMNLKGYAIGGLAVGEPQHLMLSTIEVVEPCLPPEKPRYLMGVGTPDDIVEAVRRGIDMFDCVLPTRLGRTGSALTSSGRLNLRNAQFARDSRPLDEGCACPACSRFSRAYLRHLVNQQELLGLRLLSLHNLRFLLDLTAGARAAIERGALASFKSQMLAPLNDAPAEAAWSR